MGDTLVSPKSLTIHMRTLLPGKRSEGESKKRRGKENTAEAGAHAKGPSCETSENSLFSLQHWVLWAQRTC